MFIYNINSINQKLSKLISSTIVATILISTNNLFAQNNYDIPNYKIELNYQNNNNELFKNIEILFNNSKDIYAIEQIKILNNLSKPNENGYVFLEQINLNYKENIYLNNYLDKLREIQKKYDYSILEYPISKNIDDQIKNIINSNLKELCDIRPLKTYLSLNDKIKANPKEYIELINENIKQINIVKNNLEKINLKPLIYILDITYDIDFKFNDKKTNNDLKNKIYKNDFITNLKYFSDPINKNEINGYFTDKDILMFKYFLILNEVDLSTLNEDNKNYLIQEKEYIENYCLMAFNDILNPIKSIGLNIN